MSSITTGRFANSKAIHAVSPVGGGEHTLCGHAYDMEDGFGAWADDKKARPISCFQCKTVAKYCRGLTMSTQTHDFCDADDEGDSGDIWLGSAEAEG